ncbi:MAG: hypothetical protein WCY41_04495 [Candidatus Micrarchaeia archaeon]
MTFTSELCKRFEKEPSFTSRDIRVFFAGRKLSQGYQDLMVHKLMADGRLFRISRGAYTFREEMQVVGFAFQPFYYGLQDALSLRDLWEQETTPVVITPRRAREGLRSFLGGNYTIKKISRSMFFGFEPLKYEDMWVPVSDPEKTLIDMVHFRQPLTPGLLRDLNAKIRRGVLRDYLKRVRPALAKKVRAVFPPL